MAALKELFAIFLIGDGMVGLLMPARHHRRWEHGPRPWRGLMAASRRRPWITRLLAAAGVATGLWYARRLPS